MQREYSVAEIESKAFNVELKTKNHADVDDYNDFTCSVTSSESDSESSADDIELANNDLEHESENGQVVESALKYGENDEYISNLRDDCDWLSDDESNETEMDCYEDFFESVVPIEDISPPSPLPFPLLPYEWYIKQGRLIKYACNVVKMHQSMILHCFLG